MSAVERLRLLVRAGIDQSGAADELDDEELDLLVETIVDQIVAAGWPGAGE